MLHPRVIEISTDVASSEVYVLVRFWKTPGARGRDEKPFLIEDFIMQLRLVGTRMVDPNDPSRGVENYNRSLRLEIRENIRRYIEEAERLGYKGDNTSGSAVIGDSFSIGGKIVRRRGALAGNPRRRDMSDPHGVMAKPEVAALRGKNMDL